MLDFAFPETRGQRPADFETTVKFGIALTRLAAEDPAVHRLTGDVRRPIPGSGSRAPTLDVGDANSWLRGPWLHGVPPKVKAGFDDRLA
jgi:hypothetical protein